MAFATGNSDINAAKERLEKAQRSYTGQSGSDLAFNQGQAGAGVIGQNAAQNAAASAASAGASRGEAETLAQNAGNQTTQASIAGEAQKNAEANMKNITEAENKLKEAEAEKAERQAVDEKIGKGIDMAGTSALTAAGTAIGGPIGGALGAGAGALISAGRQALGGVISKRADNAKTKFGRGLGRVASIALSDERCKALEERCGYHSKIKNEKLLHLLDEVLDESTTGKE